MNFKVIVHGAHELEAAFEEVKVKVDPTVGRALTKAAAPVRKTATDLAVANVRNIGPLWSQFRTKRARTAVYVVEKQRRGPGGSGRPNLSPLLFNRALLPAARSHRTEIEAVVAAQIMELASKIGTV